MSTSTAKVIDLPKSNLKEPVYVTVGGHTWEEAPDGEYIARCTKVDPEYRFMNNRKIAIYFTVIEGSQIGKRAILFYNKRSSKDTEELGTDFGPMSKFCTDIKRLFPEVIGDGTIPVEIDPVNMFCDEIFKIVVKRSKKEQANVIKIEHHIGW